MSTSPQKQDLSTRLLSGWFGIVWILFLAVVVTRFWWIRNAALVWWVRGRDAYFQDGVRVLPGKPTRFSTGELAPQFPDMVTGFAYFIIVTLGLSALLIFGLRVYERYHRRTHAA
jgi:hypothetical protein